MELKKIKTDKNRETILLISDHALSHTGVGTQSYHLCKGLTEIENYKVIQLGAAMRHESMEVVKVNENFEIHPIVGFGPKPMIRQYLDKYKPKSLIIFSDSRFFKHIFEMSEEIRKSCPIVWWHVWDNRPCPDFNHELYSRVDVVNCISELTYNVCKEVCDKFNLKTKINYIPHSVPKSMFFQLNETDIKYHRNMIFGKESDYFICGWINKNTRRKRPADVLQSWKIFLDELQEKRGHKKALLLMHTDPDDRFGQNLVEIANKLGILKNVRFSDQIVSYEKMNILHNVIDLNINIASLEGFGLSTLESMCVGKPILVTKTGGLTRQIINPDTLEIHGIALNPDFTTTVGTQDVPYLNEDYTSNTKVAKSLYDFYSLSIEEKTILGNKAKIYAENNFSYQKMISKWVSSLELK